MEIAVAVMTHTDPPLTMDTVDSIRCWLTQDVMVLVDEVGWKDFQDVSHPTVDIMKGAYHNFHKSPYRNYVIAMMELRAKWPKHDWYAWVESDVLVVSKTVKQIIERHKNAWMIGCDKRKYDMNFPLLNEIYGKKIRESRYLFGCTHFLAREFLQELERDDFFRRFLDQTAKFKDGHFPGYDRWAFEEELFPTLANHLGGKVEQISCWDGDRWLGNSAFAVRYQPEIEPDEVPANAAILHPVKKYDSPIRQHYRETRQKLRAFRASPSQLGAVQP